MECPICFKKANYTTHCNHSFCKECLYKWKNTCPLCRSRIYMKYPNTRAMKRKLGVMNNAVIILANIRRAEKTEDKLKISEKLFDYIWDNRIVIRKDGHLCRIIHNKSALMESQCQSIGLPSPKILKKTSTI